MAASSSTRDITTHDPLGSDLHAAARTASPRVRDVMSDEPFGLDGGAPASHAAREMAARGIGSVLVLTGGALWGIVTDRDLVVRVLATGLDPDTVPLAEICSSDPVTIGSHESCVEAEARMRELAVRRIPVVDGSDVVGIVTLGDLGICLDPWSALTDICLCPPNC